MTPVVGLVAQLLHMALMLAAAPTVRGVGRWIEARLTGRVGASPLQDWRDLVRLWRKRPVLAESASAVTETAPIIGAATTAIAVLLVPSFALGMALAPLADLLLIAGLLMAGRVVLALAAMDAGSTAGGIAASRLMLLAPLAEAALLLIVFVLALQAGSLNVDQIAGVRLERAANWGAGLGLALIATALVAFIDLVPMQALTAELGGSALALIETAGAMRLLFWFNLFGALFLPFGLADSGPLAWPIGIVAWLVRTLLLIVALSFTRVALGRVGPSRRVQALAVAVVLGGLAAVFVLTRTVAA